MQTRTTLLILAVLIAFSPDACAQNCAMGLKDRSKGIDVVMDGCIDVGTFSLGGLYNGNWETLTYYYPKPWKGTFLSIKVDDAIYVNSALPQGGESMNHYVVTAPTVSGGRVYTRWRLPEDLLVEESLETIDNSTLIHLTLKNDNPSRTLNVGVRLLLDTMLGDNDGAPIYIPGDGLQTNEKTYTRANLNFKYWKAYNTADKPSIVSTGTLKGRLSYPDKLVIAEWKKSSKTAWDYTPAGLSILGDSSVILYYDAAPLAPGKTREIDTFYGGGEEVLTRITGITEITLSNVTAQYCMGDTVGIKVDVGSRTEFSGTVGVEIRNLAGETVHTSKKPTGSIKAESVNSIGFSYIIPQNSSTDQYNITATLYDGSGNAMDQKSAIFTVDANKCLQPAKPPVKESEPNWLIIAVLLLIILATLIFILSRRKGDVIVKKVKHGDKVTVSVFNNSEHDIKKGVIEDRIVDGAEVDILTLHVRRRGTKLTLDVGTLKAGDKASLEYRIRGVSVVPKAVFRWEGGEKTSE